MSEIVVSAFLAVLFEKLGSAALEKLARYKGISSEIKKWKRLLRQIQDVLADASQKEISDPSVKRWLNGLQHLAYDIDDVLDALATEAIDREFAEQSADIASKVRKLIPACCTNILVSTRMHDRLDSITTRLQGLAEEKTTLGLSVNAVKQERSTNINRSLQTSLVDATRIVGRNKEKEALVHKLLTGEPCEHNYSIVPIVGMGGVGKTTLARLLYDEKLVNDHFELKAWVCVSDDFDILSISKVIFQSVAREKSNFEDLNLLQIALRDQLREKRFLLVLDDVWSDNYQDWETLVGPLHTCAPGSKIIMTTRKEKLLNMLGYNHLDRLKSLPDEDALSLFAQHALGANNFHLHPLLKPHGEGIVKKCDGLPLALIALGRLLRSKNNDEEYWEEVLNSEVWRLQDDGGIVPALRLSYRDLSARSKQLFAYCSLFPKDYMFDKEKLVLLWMAEGFLHQSIPSELTEERLGHTYFEELISRSFFQHAPSDDTLFVMHDLMNDLATYVADEFFLRLENEMKKDTREEALEKYRHMSFVPATYGVYKKFEVFRRAKNLRTFLAASVGVVEGWQNFYLSNQILVDLLPELPYLRVLCLSDFRIMEIPESIGSLKHLRYLNLSRTGIKYLPENVGNLFNLQTLIVFGCQNFIKLPNSFKKLKNLRHFDIKNTPLLNKMPIGIGELKSLQTLSKIIIGDDNGFEITELKGLDNLCGNVSIEGLDKVKDVVHAREVKFSQKRICELEVEWSGVFDGSRKEKFEKDVLHELKPGNVNLKQLKIVSYGGIELPNWVGDPLFLRLKHVSICGCKNCISLPPLGQLDSLKELFIKGLDGVKSVGSELLGSSVAFRSLEILSFEDMQGWEEWSTNGGDVFPCLEELTIKQCPNLDVISLGKLPSLSSLKLDTCDHGLLRSLVHVASSITKLDIEYISGLTYEVWGGVIGYLGGVEELYIYRCNEIRYLWESEAQASTVLVNLRSLKVILCDKLVSLGEKEESNLTMTSLRMLEIRDCKSMERCSCPNSLESLKIGGCDSITAISFPRGRGQKLKTLHIYGCDKLLKKEFGGGENSSVLINNSSTAMLEDVWVSRLVNLKSIIDLDQLVHLTNFVIEHCKSLETFPDHHLSHLTSLIHLIIKNCPSMDASFPSSGLVWPPKLRTLQIGGLKKPMSEWGPQNFPTSLVEIELCGGSTEEEDNGIDFSKLSYLLPSSLTCLYITNFKKLESLSTGLQHLTSLQHLKFYDCPKVMHLPEMLLPSLFGLGIYGSPKLKERCNGRGSYYWPRISHIPQIDIR